MADHWMVVSEIEAIKKSIRNHLEDLHLLFTLDAVSIDINYYNEVNLVLLAAEDSLKEATNNHEQRLKAHVEKYGAPKQTVD